MQEYEIDLIAKVEDKVNALQLDFEKNKKEAQVCNFENFIFL